MNKGQGSISEKALGVSGILFSICSMMVESIISIFRPTKYGKAALSLTRLFMAVIVGMLLFRVMVDLYVKDKIHRTKSKGQEQLTK